MRKYGLDGPLSHAIKSMYFRRAFSLVHIDVGKLISELTRGKLSSPVRMKSTYGLNC